MRLGVSGQLDPKRYSPETMNSLRVKRVIPVALSGEEPVVVLENDVGEIRAPSSQ